MLGPRICIHAYFGKKGAIDAVMQDMKEAEMLKTSDRRGTNVFVPPGAGIKTFSTVPRSSLNVLLASLNANTTTPCRCDGVVAWS